MFQTVNQMSGQIITIHANHLMLTVVDILPEYVKSILGKVTMSDKNQTLVQLIDFGKIQLWPKIQDHCDQIFKAFLSLNVWKT